MKKLMMTLIAMVTMTISAQAMSSRPELYPARLAV